MPITHRVLVCLLAAPLFAQDSGGIIVGITDSELQEARELLPPPELQPKPGLQSWNLKTDPRGLWEALARSFGLEPVFDAEYPTGASPVRFTLTDASFRESVHSLEAVTGSFIVPVNERMFLVAKDDPRKRADLEHYVAVTVPLPHTVTPQETQEVARSVQQTVELQKFAIDNTRRLALLRGPVSKVRPAQALFEQLLWHRPEVVIDIEFLELGRTSTLSYGLRLPTSFPLVNFGRLLDSATSVPQGFLRFLTFGGGRTLFGLGITDAEMFASMSKSSASLLLSGQIRCLDGQPATFHAGERFPVLTSGYFGSTGETGGTFTPPPSFNFEELGLVVKVTPKVHGIEDVSLDLEAEFKVLGSGSVNGIPIISTRRVKSIVRLREGEWAVAAGLMSSSDLRTISGIAGLSQLPLVGRLFRANTSEEIDADVVVVFRPRLLSLPATELVSPSIYFGTEARPATPLPAGA